MSTKQAHIISPFYQLGYQLYIFEILFCELNPMLRNSATCFSFRGLNLSGLGCAEKTQVLKCVLETTPLVYEAILALGRHLLVT